MSNAETVVLTTTRDETTFGEMLNTIIDSLSNHESSDDARDGDAEIDDEAGPELGKYSKDNEYGWVISRRSKHVLCRMEHFWWKQMKLNKLIQLARGDAADYIRARATKHGMTKLMVPVVMHLEMAYGTALSGLMTVGKPMETLDSIAKKWQMLQITS
jgi:hypothetical protein